MIGGSPIPQPGYHPGGYPIQQYQGRNPAPLAIPNQNPGLAQLPGTRSTQPRIRAQMDDPPARLMPLQMPSPAELGLGARGKSAEVDWSNVGQRLRRLDVTAFTLQKLPDGAFSFRCIVPTAKGPRKIEAEAVSEADAIDRALTQAEGLK